MLDSAASPPLIILEPGEVGLSGHSLFNGVTGGVPVRVTELVLQHGLSWGGGGERERRTQHVQCSSNVLSVAKTERFVLHVHVHVHLCLYNVQM